MPSRILWIDPNDNALTLEQPDLSITLASDRFEAACQLEACEFDAIVLRFLSLQGTEDEATLIDAMRSAGGIAPILIFAPHATIADAVLWTKLGASQIFQNEIDLTQELLTVARVSSLRRLACAVSGTGAPSWRDLLIGQSPKIHEIAEVIRLVAPRRCTVLITGETGTGKEVVARSLHSASNRAQFEMVSVNCSALPETLLEAELFGHVKGAFTGATSARVGRFEQAQRGTLFLDEIGDLPMPLQAKLLRVLQEREFQRLGSSETIRTDVRVVAATNVNIAEKIRTGQFREDLYYRLNVVPISMPPLRERLIDIPVLTAHFVKRICRDEEMAPKHLSDAVLQRLQMYDWPGNVRQLENAVEMAVALSGERRFLHPSDFALPSRVRRNQSNDGGFVAVPDHGLDFESTVGSIELNILEQALRKTGGNKKAAAEMLGLKRTTLAAKLKSLSDTTLGAILAQ